MARRPTNINQDEIVTNSLCSRPPSRIFFATTARLPLIKISAAMSRLAE